MKRTTAFFVPLILTAATAYSQERPRYYVEVTSPAKTVGSAAPAGSVRHYIPNPQTGNRYAETKPAESTQPSYVVVQSATREYPSTVAGHGPNVSEAAPRQYMSPPSSSYIGQGSSGYAKESMPRQYVPPTSGSNNVTLTVA